MNTHNFLGHRSKALATIGNYRGAVVELKKVSFLRGLAIILSGCSSRCLSVLDTPVGDL
jgi:hypothetical protein